MGKAGKVNLDKEVKPMSRIEIFRERLSNGEYKTVAGWATELYDYDTLEYQHRIYGMMRALRKRGVMAFPVKVDGPDRPSVVRIVNRELTNFVAVYNRHVSNFAEPMLLSSFHIAENLIREHPKTRDQVVSLAKHLIEAAADSNKTLLGLPYGKSGTLLGGGKTAPGRKTAAPNPQRGILE